MTWPPKNGPEFMLGFGPKTEDVQGEDNGQETPAFKGPARGQCLNCMDEQECDLTVPANRGDSKPYGANK